MPDSVELVVAVTVAEVIPGAIALFGAYWAFSVRRALAGRMYRNHALWLGILGVLTATVGVLTYSTNSFVNDGIAAFYSALYILVFAFIDTTIPVVRRSDPLLRSILRWDRLRVGLWCDAAVLSVASYLLYAYYYNGVYSSLTGVVYFLAAGSTFGVSGAALIVGARRSQDRVLRSSLKWLGLSLLSWVLVFLASAVESSVLPNLTEFEYFYSYYTLPYGALAILATYSLYRSTRSLVPMNRISLEP